MLLYTSRGVSGTSHFRIRGLLPLHGMLVSAGEGLQGVRSAASEHCRALHSVPTCCGYPAALPGLSRLSPVVTASTCSPCPPAAHLGSPVPWWGPGGHWGHWGWGHSAAGEMGLTQLLREKAEPPVLKIVGFFTFLLLHLYLLSLTIFCSLWHHN